ncbi:MAG TPA: SusC/RagA family TonB-linked outer membrane protein, partial [Chitinophagaceae bacterium]|nr:SusC/RagA family TonB-linked outer membrane protein [Chitinophagaceae bacterium]
MSQRLVNKVKNMQGDIERILDAVLKNSGLKYRKVSGNTFVILSNNEKHGSEMEYISPDKLDNDLGETALYDQVTGKVTDAEGNPLAGVSVTVKGTSRGVSTNLRGEFTIDANKGDILLITYVGYATQEYTIGDSRNVSISMTVSDFQMSEVVVTALGIRKEAKRLGYSVTKVDGEEFTKSREINLGNALVGKVAGVNSSGPLTGPGGSSKVIIRGINSLTGDNQPLYVVNGIPLSNNNFGSAGMWGGADLGEGLSSINPDDIEEITVLKGGAAAALYGQIAKNGVILITTKSGKGKKGLGIELNSNVQIDRINDFLEFQDVYGQGTLGAKPTDLASAMSTGMSSWGAALDGSNTIIFNGESKPYAAQDGNLGRFYETGATYTNTLAVTNGTDNTNFRLSLGDLRNNSVYPNARYIRNTVNLDVSYKLSTRWSGQVNVLYSKEVGKNRSNLSDGPGNGNYGILFLPPNVNASYLAPGYDALGNEVQFSDDAFTTNPYFAAAKFRNDTRKDRIFGVASLRYSPLSWLYIQGRVGNDFYAFNATQITPTGTAYRKGGSLDNEVSRFYNQINTDVLIGVTRNIATDFSLNLTAGANLLQQRERINTINASGLAFPYLYNPGAATTRGANTATPRKDVRSLYGSLELAYDNFLFLNVTDRNDWSSTIPLENNSYNYPSVNASYVFTEHLKSSWLNFGKLRIGYSQIGADAEPFKTLLYYNTNGAINNQPLGQLGDVIPNSQLEPLQIKEFEVGAQLALFKSRMNVDVAWYSKKTLNDIVEGSVSTTSGYRAALVNIGKVENKGIEVLVSGYPVKGRNFSWNSSFNFAHNNNEVVELAEGQSFMELSQSRTTRGFIHHRIGEPAFQVMVYDYRKDNKGALVLSPSNFPQSAEGLTAAGTSIHPTVGGWNNQFTYKQISLEFLIDYKYGAVIYSGTNARAYGNGLHRETLIGRTGGVAVNGVDDDGNPVTETISAQDYYGALSNISMVQTYDADFIKFRSVSITYNFPASILRNKVQGLSISLVGRNLFYIKKSTPNIDPEANYSNGFSYGLEYASLPSSKTYGLNLNVRF